MSTPGRGEHRDPPTDTPPDRTAHTALPTPHIDGPDTPGDKATRADNMSPPLRGWSAAMWEARPRTWQEALNRAAQALFVGLICLTIIYAPQHIFRVLPFALLLPATRLITRPSAVRERGPAAGRYALLIAGAISYLAPITFGLAGYGGLLGSVILLLLYSVVLTATSEHRVRTPSIAAQLLVVAPLTIVAQIVLLHLLIWLDPQLGSIGASAMTLLLTGAGLLLLVDLGVRGLIAATQHVPATGLIASARRQVTVALACFLFFVSIFATDPSAEIAITLAAGGVVFGSFTLGLFLGDIFAWGVRIVSTLVVEGLRHLWDADRGRVGSEAPEGAGGTIVDDGARTAAIVSKGVLAIGRSVFLVICVYLALSLWFAGIFATLQRLPTNVTSSRIEEFGASYYLSHLTLAGFGDDESFKRLFAAGEQRIVGQIAIAVQMTVHVLLIPLFLAAFALDEPIKDLLRLILSRRSAEAEPPQLGHATQIARDD
jgi:hypothetical protein